MSFEVVLQRVDQIESMLAATAATPTTDDSTSSTSSGSFADVLANQGATSPTASTTSTTATPVATTATSRTALPATTVIGATNATTPAVGTAPAADEGQAIVNVAASQVGVTEQPPGSNDGPQIAVYRSAVAGAGVGPWCAQFASWVAKQAGEPLGEQGQGFESVSAIYGWAQRTGRAEPVGSSYTPKAGDLIVWGGEHVGIVSAVDPDGTIHTIEGNAGNAVTRHTYGPDGGGATGFVSMS